MTKFTSPFQTTEQEKTKTIQLDNYKEFSTYELKQFLGDFERQYREHAIGEIMQNDILGCEYEGIISWLLAKKAINQKGKEWYVCPSAYNDFSLKYRIMRELEQRREYADKINSESMASQEGFAKYLPNETHKQKIALEKMINGIKKSISSQKENGHQPLNAEAMLKKMELKLSEIN